MSHGQVRALLCFVRCGIKWQHSTLRSDETTNPHSRELHTSCYPPSQYCNMSPAGIMDATIPIAFSVSPTVPTPTPSPETDVYHRGGIRGKVESLIYGTCRCGMNYAASHGTDTTGTPHSQASRISSSPDTTNHFTEEPRLSGGHAPGVLSSCKRWAQFIQRREGRHTGRPPSGLVQVAAYDVCFARLPFHGAPGICHWTVGIFNWDHRGDCTTIVT